MTTRLLAFLLLLLGCVPAAAAAPPLTERDRAEIVAQAADLLERRYVDAAAGARLAAALRAQAPAWDGVADPAAFAAAVTAWLRRASGDGHLGLSHSETPIPERTDGGADFAADMDRWYGPGVNHGVERIERLDGNIMLLELTVFPPAAIGGDVLAAAMNVVAQGEALILDLRRNGGGAETANLVTGYLLGEGGRPLSGRYDRPSDTAHANSSPVWVPGRRFGGDKPLFILTSRRTFSAAEAVAYDLQALGRATIVGEVTGGGAHPYEYRRVHPHFALDLPEGRSVNPITGGNWQGTGVRPDVEVPAAEALDRALQLAREAVARGGDDPTGRSAAGPDPRALPSSAPGR
ncbi:S41 family peptidase [Sphingosinicella terrae]|uniref:S41 family peptidase n=1 Tax=Sphingosinicella terrae TaxID=2172047 RepID=UPI000E0D96CD|nr:S41 family peptidase [Sphingosinicella terrae]